MTSSIDNGREQQLLARTMAAMEALQQRLKAQADREREPIAVIGLGCRFPGVGGPDAFAAFLARGESAIGRLSPARIAEGSGPGAAIYQTGGFFPDVSAFDAEAFGLNADEALAMDPHLRFLLEVTRDAIDDAGLGGKRLAGTRTGVFLALGAQNSDYATALMSADGEHARHAIAGSFHSLMTGRISYHFDLRGPSFVVDAACASSLVAVDLACQALRRGDCETAIVGAVNLILSDAVSRAIDRHGLWSKQGCVSSHDERADGFVRGEGVGVLVLRRASDATRQENPVRAMILGAATGQDGHGNGIAAPNAPAQLAVIERALKQAAVSAGAIAHVECHATGDGGHRPSLWRGCRAGPARRGGGTEAAARPPRGSVRHGGPRQGVPGAGSGPVAARAASPDTERRDRCIGGQPRLLVDRRGVAG